MNRKQKRAANAMKPNRITLGDLNKSQAECEKEMADTEKKFARVQKLLAKTQQQYQALQIQLAGLKMAKNTMLLLKAKYFGQNEQADTDKTQER